jgi:hypothetical protein
MQPPVESKAEMYFRRRNGKGGGIDSEASKIQWTA